MHGESQELNDGMITLPESKTSPIPLPVDDRCPAGCDVSSALLCWLRRRRELLTDLAAARGSASPDVEVLHADLVDADRRIDGLIAFGRTAA